MKDKSSDPAPAGLGFSSPPCYATEFPGYFGEGADAAEAPSGVDPELIEAERAGARVLAVLRDGLESAAPARALLEAVQKDEGANAVMLYQTIRRLGGMASHEL